MRSPLPDPRPLSTLGITPSLPPSSSVSLLLPLLPAVSLSNQRYHDREDASSMVKAGATTNTTEGNSRAYRASGLLRSHSHGESIAPRR